jgi:hypothetical protein
MDGEYISILNEIILAYFKMLSQDSPRDAKKPR